MYSELVFLCLAVVTVRSAPATDVVPLEKQQPTVIPIVSQSEELESNGTYKFSYETGNGIKREETSYDKVLPKVTGRSATDSNEGGESDESNEIHVQQGSYSYTAPDGTLISVRYIADENGFRPIGDHIPQSIVAAAAAAGGSSGEKSGRALKLADSADSASAPKAAAAPAPTAAAAPAPKAAAAPAPPALKPDEKKPEAEPESAPAEPSGGSTTEAAKSTESEGTTENASEASPSTTEGGTTPGSSEATDASTAAEATTKAAEATTQAAEDTTKAAEATTKAADATTVAASEGPASTDASTTEIASTTAAA